MKNRRLMLTAALSLLTVGGAFAQAGDTRGELKSYSYIEAQGGVQLTSTNAPMDKLITPTAALSFGHYFTPVVGARLHVNAWEAKSGFKDIDKYYKWKYVTPDLDLMVNLTNLFSKKASHALNVILLGGVGLNYAWDNAELRDLQLDAQRTPLAWGIKDGESKNRLSHNLRAGLRLETNVTKPFGIALEVNANSLSDRFNSKTNNSDDWMFTAMLGLNFRFGYRYKKAEPAPEPVVEQVVEEPAPVVVPPVVPEKKAVVKTEAVKLHEEIFYVICKSDPTEGGTAQLERVAKFIKENKDARVSIVGYADKGTGNARLNKMYAERRAAQCKDALVKKYGVDPSRVTIDSKGDTVQPFSENDKNRCVIIDGNGTHEYTVYE